MIPLLRQTTCRAFVPTVGEFLWNMLTAGACLACATGIDGHDLRTSFFGFVRQDVHELAPGHVRDCPAQLAVLEHPTDIQALDNDEAKGKDQTAGDLIVMLTPAVGDVSVNLLDARDRLITIRAAQLLTGFRPLGAAQFGQGVLEIARVRLLPSVAIGEEARQPHVDADVRKIARIDSDIGQFAREHNKPFSRFPLETDSLDCAFDRAMELDADRPDVLNVEAIAEKLRTIGKSEFNAVEPIAAFESWVTGFCCAFLNATEEIVKRFFAPLHRLSGRMNIEASVIRIRSSLHREPTREIEITHRRTTALPSVLLPLKAEVIETPMRLKGNAKIALLIRVREQAVFE